MRPNPLFAGTILCFISLFSACSKSSQQSNTAPVPASVYIAGQGQGNSVWVAKYWKDSAQVILPDSTQSEYISAIYVSGNDVYLAGTESPLSGITKAAYWKNGVKTLMNEPGSGASGITVSGNDVYISGYIINSSNGHMQAVYWKNGVVVSFSSSLIDYTSAIAVSGNDVYVAGYESNPFDPSRNIAKYWKNGIAVNLSDTANTAQATAIFISGSDVYVAGYESVQNSNWFAKYWKNGVPVTLAEGSSGTWLTGICVSGTDVYTCGTVCGLGTFSATYWKNGNMINLETSNTVYSEATGIAVFENDVYVSGNEDSYPKYWKNGNVVNITPGKPGDQARGISVVPK